MLYYLYALYHMVYFCCLGFLIVTNIVTDENVTRSGEPLEAGIVVFAAMLLMLDLLFSALTSIVMVRHLSLLRKVNPLLLIVNFLYALMFTIVLVSILQDQRGNDESGYGQFLIYKQIAVSVISGVTSIIAIAMLSFKKASLKF